ncbi:MAG TPA: hypothetical protein VGM88_02210 [Kofleriaceae bacterium]|jgi:hypothetical protein
MKLAAAALVTLLAATANAEPPRSPESFATLLAKYDAATPTEREQLAPLVDAAAGQRYATRSRLYWYTDLDAAKAAAHAQKKPILALRMLGRLDEDLSCANSRFFRVALYANKDLSAYLRANFILYWSTERAAPKITIDFGDGRVIERTITGNSAHYVLDAEGRVLDVLPGLYAPSVFRAELDKSLALATKLRGARTDADRIAAVRAYHAAGIAEEQRSFAKLADKQYDARTQRLASADSASRAQYATVSKAAVEVPMMKRFGARADMIPADDTAQWAAIGRNAFGLGRDPYGMTTELLDAQSRELADALVDAKPAPAIEPWRRDVILAQFEQAIAGDTAIDELALRPRIRSIVCASDTLDFATINGRIYDYVFSTPSSDPYLGLLPRDTFTGLPADGLVRTEP